jgi:DNA-binding Lrp family transcriptional regulator
VADDLSNEAGGPPPKIDRTDRAILAALAEDGRLSVAEVSRRANVSRANAYMRIERLTSAGIITGYGARIDSRRLGLDVSALVFLRVDQVGWRRLREKLLEVEEVEMIGLTSGDFDFVVLVRASSTVELRDVVLARFLAMEGVRGTQTLLLFDDVVRRPCVPTV